MNMTAVLITAIICLTIVAISWHSDNTKRR